MATVAKGNADKNVKTGGNAKPAAGNAAKTTSGNTAASNVSTHDASQDLPPVANARSRNIRLVLRDRVKAETAELIKTEAANKAAPKNGDVKRKKKFSPKKPTKDEKGVLNRLRKHDNTKAPAFEKSLNEKYSLKKKAAPEKKK